MFLQYTFTPRTFIVILLLQCPFEMLAQPRSEADGRRRGGPGGGRELALLSRFDADGDGVLRGQERRSARQFAKQERQGSRRRSGGEQRKIEAGNRVTISDVHAFQGRDFYDPSIVRTLFLNFQNEDWESEMSDFYRSDVLVPATLIVDGFTYKNIGVSFRGNSSYFTVPSGQKRSLNLVIDYINSEQHLLGYRTINLLNAHADPSFLREVIYNMVARNYIPAPLCNFVRLIINGEDWGIYINAQQLNKEFTQTWFGSRKGIRWKVRAGRGPRALNYNGEDIANYMSLYESKTKDSPQAWTDLIRVCRELNTLPIEDLDMHLDSIFDVDRALWFLALDNVLIDADGYYARGSDYMLYQEPEYGRFHILPYDSNETFRYPGGGGPGGGARIVVEKVKLNPFEGEQNQARPLIHRLMRNPKIRARYLAHVRTMVDEWFESGRLEAMMKQHHKLISNWIRIDKKRLYTMQSFETNLHKETSGGRRPLPGLLDFVKQRRDYFRGFNDFQIQAPKIRRVFREHYEKAPRAGEPVGIRVSLDSPSSKTEVWIYFAKNRNQRFQSIQAEPMQDGIYRGEIPAMRAGDQVFYYVEARHHAERIVSRFSPRNTILGAPSFKVFPKETSDCPLVINEIMPFNTSVVPDPQGEFEDWIELFNPSDAAIDLSEMFLSDRLTDLRRWRFPKGSRILPRSYLLIWANGNADKKGLHASFKLAANGETIYLIDKDSRGNAIIDQLTYDRVNEKESFGRLPSGKLGVMPPTPASKNR